QTVQRPHMDAVETDDRLAERAIGARVIRIRMRLHDDDRCAGGVVILSGHCPQPCPMSRDGSMRPRCSALLLDASLPPMRGNERTGGLRSRRELSPLPDLPPQGGTGPINEPHD